MPEETEEEICRNVKSINVRLKIINPSQIKKAVTTGLHPLILMIGNASEKEDLCTKMLHVYKHLAIKLEGEILKLHVLICP